MHKKISNTIPAGYKYCVCTVYKCVCTMLGGVGEGTGEHVSVRLEAGALLAWFQVKVILFSSDE